MYDSNIYEKFTSKEHMLQLNKIPLRIIHRHHTQIEYIALHSHEFLELAVVNKGSANHVIHLPDNEEMIYKLSRGSVYIVAPEEKHTFTFENDEEIWITNLLFSPIIVRESAKTIWDDLDAADFIETYPYTPLTHRTQFQIILNQEELLKTEQLIGEIEWELKKKLIGFNTVVQLNFTKMLFLIMRCYYTSVGDAAELGREQNTIVGVLNYIDRHFKHGVSLKTLSEMSGFSERHLARKFKSLTGMSISDYLLCRRLSEAKQLLTSTDFKISDICSQSGFNDTSYFCSQFRKLTGCSPGQYREKNQSG